MAGSLHLLIQLMSSHERCFLFAISWILKSKNDCFVFLIVIQKAFQSSILFDNLYFSRSQLQFSSHQLFECLMILTIFEFFIQLLSTMLANLLTIFLKWGISNKLDMSIFLKNTITSLTNDSFSSLSLMIVIF